MIRLLNAKCSVTTTPPTKNNFPRILLFIYNFYIKKLSSRIHIISFPLSPQSVMLRAKSKKKHKYKYPAQIMIIPLIMKIVFSSTLSAKKHGHNTI